MRGLEEFMRELDTQDKDHEEGNRRFSNHWEK